MLLFFISFLQQPPSTNVNSDSENVENCHLDYFDFAIFGAFAVEYYMWYLANAVPFSVSTTHTRYGSLHGARTGSF